MKEQKNNIPLSVILMSSIKKEKEKKNSFQTFLSQNIKW